MNMDELRKTNFYRWKNDEISGELTWDFSDRNWFFLPLVLKKDRELEDMGKSP